MHIFLDTANTQDIKTLWETGLVDGVTTNPSLLAKVSGRPLDTLKEIASIVSGPISAEVTADTYEEMLTEAKMLQAVAPNIVIKVPLTQEGLRACRFLSLEGVSVNVTLCFSVNQALLAAKAGASYLSPFIGRLDDCGARGAELLEDIRAMYDMFPNNTTKILAASIRTPQHVTEAALAGCDCITIPPSLFTQLYHHPLTTKGLEIFAQDWKKTQGF